MATTTRHFFPNFNGLLAQLPDRRDPERVEYAVPFLMWWELVMFSGKLGSRRQLDYQLRYSPCVLENINRLAGTSQTTLPSNKTPDYLLHLTDPRNLANVRREMNRQLLEDRVLDNDRLEGRIVVAVDGTCFLTFTRRHCDRCITQRHATGTIYLHPVLEAKIVSARGLALSIGTEFIENPPGLTDGDYQSIKQDCELTAFKQRLAPQLKADFPRLAICIVCDALFACGPVMAICEGYRWDYILSFKQGSLPTVWENVQQLLLLVPNNTRTIDLPGGGRQVYRWVNRVPYVDSEGREHTFDVIICEETVDAKTTTFAWITSFTVTKDNVVNIATNGGRPRWNIENQGFNTQKNGGYNLEHAYSHDPNVMKCYYYLLQIAHTIMQLVEKGSLLKAAARTCGDTVAAFFGGLRGIARCLLDCLRFFRIPEAAFDPDAARHIQIRLDTS